jgi:plastocyanin domain-containing protein
MKYAIILGIAALFVLAACSTTTEPGTNGATANIVKVNFQNGEYVFTPSTVKAGEPVTLQFQAEEFNGCERSFNIHSEGVKKVIRPGDTQVTFTPTAPGELTASCGMNMYFGTLNVE